MNQGHETEIKLPIRNLAAARRKILRLGLRKVRPRHFERNILYDFPDLRLRKGRCLLRLRNVGREWLLTFKGPPAAVKDYKSREEIETTIKNGGNLRTILERLGMRQVFRYDKYRTVFAPRSAGRGVRGCMLTLDETPIGNYLELEGPETWIDQTATRLGHERGEYIIASYAALYRQHCEMRGKSPSDMVFESRRV